MTFSIRQFIFRLNHGGGQAPPNIRRHTTGDYQHGRIGASGRGAAFHPVHPWHRQVQK